MPFTPIQVWFKRTLILLMLGASAVWAEAPVIEVVATQVDQQLVVDGVVEAVSQGTLKAQTSGRIQALHVDVDDRVAPGTLLIEIENTEQRAGLQKAKSQLTEAQAVRVQAANDHARSSDLFDRKAISKAEMDRSKAAFESAKARVVLAQAAVVEAEKQLSYTRISAPYEGIVTERFVEVGESVQPGMALISGYAQKPLRVVASVPQGVAEVLKQPQQIGVLLASGVPVTPQRLTVFPYANPENHLVTVRMRLPESVEVRPGAFVKVSLTVAQKPAFLLPRQAILVRNELQAVFVATEAGPVLRQVRMGRQHQQQVEILSGLKAGEKALLDPEAVLQRMSREGV